MINKIIKENANFISGLNFKKIKTKQKNKPKSRKNCVLTNFIKSRTSSENARQNSFLQKSPKTHLSCNLKKDLVFKDSLLSHYNKRKAPSDIFSLKLKKQNINLLSVKNLTGRNKKIEENKIFLSNIENEYEIRCLKKKIQILKQKNFMLNYNITNIKKTNDKVEKIISSEHNNKKNIICTIINIVNANFNKNDQDSISSFKDLLFYLMEVKTDYENLLLNLNFFEGLKQLIGLINFNNNENDFMNILDIISNLSKSKHNIINEMKKYQLINSNKTYFKFIQSLFKKLNTNNFNELFKYLQDIKRHNDNELKEITKIKNVLLTDNSPNINNIYNNPDFLNINVNHPNTKLSTNYTAMNKFIIENNINRNIIRRKNINKQIFHKMCTHSKTHKQISFNNKLLFPKTNQLYNDNSSIINNSNINNFNFFSQEKKKKTKNIVKNKFNFDKTNSLVSDYIFHSSSNNNIKIEREDSFEDIKIQNKDKVSNFYSANNNMKNKIAKKINTSLIFKNNKNGIFNQAASFCYDRSNLTERRENSFNNNRIANEISKNYKNIIRNKKKKLKIKTPAIRVNKISSVFSFNVYK